LSVGDSSLAVTSSQQPAASGDSILMTYAGLLARYDQMTFLEKLRDEVTRGKNLKSCWLLIPGDQQAMMDGKAVPVIGPGQRAKIPESWLMNVHRSCQ